MCTLPIQPGALGTEPSNSVPAFRQLLEAARDELRRTRRADLAIEHAAEPVEAATLYQQRDQAAQLSERDSQRLGAVLNALQRITDGVYGVCLICEEPIPAKRLRAIPWCLYCLPCQVQVDAEKAAERAGVVLKED